MNKRITCLIFRNIRVLIHCLQSPQLDRIVDLSYRIVSYIWITLTTEVTVLRLTAPLTIASASWSGVCMVWKSGLLTSAPIPTSVRIRVTSLHRTASSTGNVYTVRGQFHKAKKVCNYKDNVCNYTFFYFCFLNIYSLLIAIYKFQICLHIVICK